MKTEKAQKIRKQIGLSNDPEWYKDAIIYQLHVRSFYDSDGDGIGDFRGLTQKLDYIKELGVTAIWLLPFYPSPLRDDGYDIADYTGVNPSYGSLADFRELLREAHKRQLRVITELVINHTSDQHPWFQRARRSKPGSKYRNYYVWSDTPERYTDARIIFKDFELSNWSWDPVANAYYWHRFYSHQPDLNFENPAVRRDIIRNLDFWMELGVDGMRLDAVPYLFEKDNTNCENLPETHAFLKELRKHVDKNFENRMLLAEANQWPEDAVAYFGSGQGDECHMAFHFPVMPRLFMALRMEDRYPIIDILEQTPSIPELSQWAVFLRNHDELTLEMVTDEERDYMYRMFANEPKARINLGIRRRLAPLIGNERRRIELMNCLLMSLPGTPIIYYGDEIGIGDNIYLGDRNGVRTPMQWSADRNAGFSRANPQKLFLPIIIDPEYHYETVNVEANQNNPNSLLWWTRRLLALRKQHKAFGRGSIQFMHPDNRKVIAFIRTFENESILCVANLSRHVQYVELDMAAYEGRNPIELFGRTQFPRIGELPYLLTLNPHGFFWFSLEPEDVDTRVVTTEARHARLPVIPIGERWESLFEDPYKAALETVLPEYIRSRRWFGAKTKHIQSVTIDEIFEIPSTHEPSFIILVRIEFEDGDFQSYVMPLAIATEANAEHLVRDLPFSVIARIPGGLTGMEGVLYDAMVDESFCKIFPGFIANRRQLNGRTGTIKATCSHAFRKAYNADFKFDFHVSHIKGEQSNTSIIFGERYIMKLYRRVEEGSNPDLEIGRFLTEKRFPHVPGVVGAIEAHQNKHPLALAILQEFVPSEGDCWKYTIDSVGRFYERVLTGQLPNDETLRVEETLLDLSERELPDFAGEYIGTYLELARLLGQRTGALHTTLSSADDNSDFAPEAFTPLYQRSMYQSMRGSAKRRLDLLKKNIRSLPPGVLSDANKVLELESEILNRFKRLTDHKITGQRIRCHGDYHLGQVLYTGKDIVIIDFEGEPAQSLSQRRLKRSPLRDVAGMLRSFHYAAMAAFFDLQKKGMVTSENIGNFEQWPRFWCRWSSVSFLKAYLDTTKRNEILPKTHTEIMILLDAFMLEKAIYELEYELNNRPDWVSAPLQGILQLI